MPFYSYKEEEICRINENTFLKTDLAKMKCVENVYQIASIFLRIWEYLSVNVKRLRINEF